MKKTCRVLAAALVCLLAAVMLFSAVYIALAADHDCEGDDCPICALLSACESVLSRLMHVHTAAIAAALAGLRICPAGKTRARTGAFPTPITLKIKLSD